MPQPSNPNYVIGKALKSTGGVAIGAGIPCLLAGTILLAVGSHVSEVDFGNGYLSDKEKFDKLEAASKNAEAKGKMQYGPAWWFLDNKVGMERHLDDLTSTGHLATFVGMLTDSRSFLSYPRHHYFRRILCNFLGGMMERGEMTQDEAFVGKVVQDICYHNSMNYLNMK